MLRIRLIGGPLADEVMVIEQGGTRELRVPYINPDQTAYWTVTDILTTNIKVALYRVFPKFKTAVYQGDQ